MCEYLRVDFDLFFYRSKETLVDSDLRDLSGQGARNLMPAGRGGDTRELRGWEGLQELGEEMAIRGIHKVAGTERKRKKCTVSCAIGKACNSPRWIPCESHAKDTQASSKGL